MTIMRLSPSYRDALYLVTFALSLVLFLSAGLFVSVALNKKSEDYGNLPWSYALGSLVLSIVLWFVSRVFMGSPKSKNFTDTDDSRKSPFSPDAEAVRVNGKFEK